MGKAEGAKKETTKPEQTGPSKCLAQGCKSSEKKFNFCDEHYDHFKFGLITKMGLPVSDYEKKFGHYQAWKSRGARKAA